MTSNFVNQTLELNVSKYMPTIRFPSTMESLPQKRKNLPNNSVK